MRKRIALFILGLALFFGAFELYQYFTGATFTGRTPHETGPDLAKVAATMKYMIDVTDPETARPEYHVEADSIAQMKDADGAALAGQYLFKRPVVTFYQKDGRTVEVGADQGVVVLDQTVTASLGGTGMTLTGQQAGGGGGGSGSGGAAAGTAKNNKILQAVRIAQLQGHVRLMVTARLREAASAAASSLALDALKGESKIFFENDLMFDRDKQLLSTTGPIHIRSEALSFDGKGMELSMSTEGDTRTIQYLGIDQGDTILLHHGAKALTVVDPTAKAAGGAGGVAKAGGAEVPATVAGPVVAATTQAVASTKPVKGPALAPGVYRLTFGEDVRASAGKEKQTSSLTSSRLYLTFMLSQGSAAKKGADATLPATTGQAVVPGLLPAMGDAPIATATAPAAVAFDQDHAGPMPAVVEDDLVVQWHGKMEMRPAKGEDLAPIGGKLADGSDMVLEAVGTAEKPVEVVVMNSAAEKPANGAAANGAAPADAARFKVLTGRMWYHRSEDKVTLDGDVFKRVELQDLSQSLAGGALAPAGLEPRVTVTAPHVSFFPGPVEGERRAVLGGPGTLVARTLSKSGEEIPGSIPTTIAWKDEMDVAMGMAPDLKNPGRKTLAVQEATFHGAGFHNGSVDLTTDLLTAVVANASDPHQKPALESLLAQGHVQANSLRRDNKAIAPGAPTDGLRSDVMRIVTARRGGPASMPEPAQLIATGNASAWQYVSKDLFNDTGTTRPAMVGLQKELVSSDRFVADLRPKSHAPAAAGTVEDMGFAGMGSEVEVAHFEATREVRIEITSPDTANHPPILASADSLDVTLGAGGAEGDSADALLKAAEGAGALVRLNVGPDNAIQGRSLALHRTKTDEQFAVAGAGEFFAQLPPKANEKPTPLHVTWEKSMAYDNKTKLALFTGSPVAELAGDQPQLGWIKCDNRLTVQLMAAAASTKPAATANGGGGMLGGGNLTLDYIKAEGNVDARGGQLAPDNTLLSELSLNAPGELTYRESKHRFDVPGPGTLAVINNKPDKADQQVGTAGTSVFAWAGALAYDGDANTIDFSKQVRFIFKPLKPFKLSTAKGGGGAGRAGEGGALGALGPVGNVTQAELTTEHLVATLMKSKDSGKAVASPIGLGAGGNQELKTVAADGGVTELNIGDFLLKGSSIGFDALTHIATASGKGDDQALIKRPNEVTSFADKIVWDVTKDANDIKLTGARVIIEGSGN